MLPKLSTTDYQPERTIPMVKHDKSRTVLEENLLEATEDLRLRGKLFFQQDEHIKHTARAGINWFRSKHYHMLEPPSQSPGLNLIQV